MLAPSGVRADGEAAGLAGHAEDLGGGQDYRGEIEAPRELLADAVDQHMADLGLQLRAAQHDDLVLLGERVVGDGVVELAMLREHEAVDAVAALAARGDPLEVALDGAAGVVGGVGRVRVQIEVEAPPGAFVAADRSALPLPAARGPALRVRPIVGQRAPAVECAGGAWRGVRGEARPAAPRPEAGARRPSASVVRRR